MCVYIRIMYLRAAIEVGVSGYQGFITRFWVVILVV